MKNFLLKFLVGFKESLIIIAMFITVAILLAGSMVLFGWLMNYLPIMDKILRLIATSIITVIALSAAIGLLVALFDD
jgi:hypothetical protein